MSAFIVEEECINNIIAFIDRDRSDYRKDYLRRIIQEAGFDIDSTKGLRALGQALWRMNAIAVSDRYGEKVQKVTFKWDVYNLPANLRSAFILFPIQAYKSAQCLGYQCSEGNVPESDLYELLYKIIDAMANYIAQSLPEYQTVKWGG